jgi:hypothetical protein
LELSDQHRSNLRGRGLTDQQIQTNEYRSLPTRGQRGKHFLRPFFKALEEHFTPQDWKERLIAQYPNLKEWLERGHKDDSKQQKKPDLLSVVPGFVLNETGDGHELVPGGGLLIPVRDDRQRIVALKIRSDRTDFGQKYFYLSSYKYGGPGPGCPVHHPLAPVHFSACPEVGRLTEGELKADVCMLLSGIYTVSCPGVANWKLALEAVRRFAGTIRLAFDADCRRNPTVAKSLRDCAKAIVDADRKLELETWNEEDGKGLDDLLVAGKKPRLLAGRKALAECEKIADQAGLDSSKIEIKRTRRPGHYLIHCTLEL